VSDREETLIQNAAQKFLLEVSRKAMGDVTKRSGDTDKSILW